MSSRSDRFGAAFSNVPLVNPRWEFRDLFQCAHTPGFLKHEDGRGRPLETHYFIWLGMPDAGATTMVSRAVTGLESYLKAAVKHESFRRGVSTPELRAACDNPFSIGRQAADAHFNRLPALLAEDLAMRIQDAQLWEDTAAFYREIRNPIFHGREFNGITDEILAALFDHLAEVYRWIDGWHDPDSVMSGLAESVRM